MKSRINIISGSEIVMIILNLEAQIYLFTAFLVLFCFISNEQIVKAGLYHILYLSNILLFTHYFFNFFYINLVKKKFRKNANHVDDIRSCYFDGFYDFYTELRSIISKIEIVQIPGVFIAKIFL